MTPDTPAPVHLIGLVGSLRQGSFNRALMAAAVELAPPGLRITPRTLHGIPLYDGDLEAEGIPAAVTDLADAIRGADGVLIASPEYNHGIPGVLKNTIDWLSRRGVGNPFRDRPAGVIGASNGVIGTARAQIAARHVLTTLGALVLPPPEVLVGNAQDRFDDKGRLRDERTREVLGTWLGRMEGWVRRVGGQADGRAGGQ